MNVGATLRLLDFARSRGITRFVLASTATFSDVLLPAPFGLFRKFCFDPLPILDSLVGGPNPWVIRLTDAAGTSRRPVLRSTCDP